jgi:hypothetical protein
MVLGTGEPGRSRPDGADEPARAARSRVAGRLHVSSRQSMMAVAVCSAAFCGGTSAVFLWAIPAVAGAEQPAGRAGVTPEETTVPPGGTAQYVFSVDARTRHALVRAYALPDAATVDLSCPSGPDGQACWLRNAGPVDIPATVYVPDSIAPGTRIRVTEVESDRSGTTTQEAVTQVVAPQPTRTGTPTPSPSGDKSPSPSPSGDRTPRPSPTRTGTRTPPPTSTKTPQPTHTGDPTHTATPTPKPTHTKPAPKPTHTTKPTPKPTRTTKPTPKPGHHSTPPTKGGTTHHPGPGHSHRALPVAGGKGPTGNGPPVNGQVGAPVGNGHAPGGAGRTLPLPTVSPGPIAAGRPAAGDIGLPPADQPAPAPILPTDARPQPSPLPLPRVTASPQSDPGNQTVVLPNRAASASNQSPSTFDLVEAQVIGLFLALAGALAALLRPVRARARQAQDQRAERLRGASAAAARPRRYRLLPWPRGPKQ